MFSRWGAKVGVRTARAAQSAATGSRRQFGAGGHGHGPHVPEFYDRLSKFCLISAFFWIMYRAKENKGQLFGWYAPWLHEHEHGDHPHFVEAGDQGDAMPTAEEEHGDDDDDEEE